MPAVATKPSLTLKRRFKAPKERVFAAWTDPEKLSLWFGPAHVTVLEAQADPREGGRYRIVALASDGERHEVGGTYKEIVAHEKLVFTWAWKTMPERESIVTVLLKDDGGGTLLTLTHEQFFDEAARDRHEYGWTGSLDKLDAFLSA